MGESVTMSFEFYDRGAGRQGAARMPLGSDGELVQGDIGDNPSRDAIPLRDATLGTLQAEQLDGADDGFDFVAGAGEGAARGGESEWRYVPVRRAVDVEDPDAIGFGADAAEPQPILPTEELYGNYNWD